MIEVNKNTLAGGSGCPQKDRSENRTEAGRPENAVPQPGAQCSGRSRKRKAGRDHPEGRGRCQDQGRHQRNHPAEGTDRGRAEGDLRVHQVQSRIRSDGAHDLKIGRQ